jgi:hypothetical protein
MQRNNVVLVVPKEYKTTFAKDYRKNLLSLSEFIDLVVKTQANQ